MHLSLEFTSHNIKPAKPSSKVYCNNA